MENKQPKIDLEDVTLNTFNTSTTDNTYEMLDVENNNNVSSVEDTISNLDVNTLIKDKDIEEIIPELEYQVKEKHMNTFLLKEYKTNDISYKPPVSNTKDILDLTKYLYGEDEEMSDKRFLKITKKNRKLIDITQDNFEAANKNVLLDPYESRLNNNDNVFVESITFGNKTIEPKKLNIKEGNAAGVTLARIAKSMSNGENVQMPLWHSGIWITIKPVTAQSLIVLKRELDRTQIEIGKATGGLVYSNRSIGLYRVIMDFISNNILNTTLKLDVDDDIRDYIAIEDLPLMILALSIALYPNGYRTRLACSNTTILSENEELKCDVVEDGIMNLSSLLRVDRSRIDDFMLETMANRTPNSVDKVRLEEYRIRINNFNKDLSNIKIKLEDDSNLEIGLGSPMSSKYFYRGQIWIDNIIKQLELFMIDDDDDDSKAIAIEELITSAILGIYNTYVEYIDIDGSRETDDKEILKILEQLSSNDDVYNSFFESLNKYIGESPVAIVATTNFTCPKCQTTKKPKSEGNNWDSYIALDPLNYFLDLLILKLNYLRKR